MESSIRPPLSPRDFALQVAAAQCMADGPDGSTYCTDVGVRSTFKTAQGFQAFEIRLTEVRETVSPAKTEKRKRDPVFALDLSDDETYLSSTPQFPSWWVFHVASAAAPVPAAAERIVATITVLSASA
jgi:hypothetical protein